ncbi:hypothetical protein SVAN01_02386 [Stagonosporopsis vannaccii]|nr:hypothetical protein SVAN01_02386 [Stagonosporopsis vannaccii]
MDTGVRQKGLTVLRRLGGPYQLWDAWDPSDDWTGITSTAERKRRQNRLNQRKYRRKRKAQTEETPKIQTTAHSVVLPAYGEHSAKEERSRALLHQKSTPVIRASEALLSEGPVLLTCPHRIARIRELLRHVYEEYSLSSPRPTTLPILIRLNVLNALARNATLMGFPPEGLCSEDMISPYNEEGPEPCGLTRRLSMCPDTLAPTTLQRGVRHHPWIDLFPFPNFRDNILRATHAGLLNEDDLCIDLLNVEAEDLGTRPALMVWGESSDIWGWEANISFFRKWGWLVRGCPEILEVSNYWREKRGERRFLLQTY